MADVLGYVAGVFALVTFVPQIVKTLRTRSAGDLSFAMLVLTLLSLSLYLAYGVLLRLYPVVIMLTLRLVLVAVQTGLTWRYQRAARAA